MRYIILFVAASLIATVPAWAQFTYFFRGAVSAPPATSCNAIITGSGTATAILTGTATALAKLTCQ